MATRNVVLRQQQHELAMIAALSEAADRGWADLASECYDDLTNDALDDSIAERGVHARSAD